jgi:hypothetical protein
MLSGHSGIFHVGKLNRDFQAHFFDSRVRWYMGPDSLIAQISPESQGRRIDRIVALIQFHHPNPIPYGRETCNEHRATREITFHIDLIANISPHAVVFPDQCEETNIFQILERGQECDLDDPGEGVRFQWHR